MKTLVYLPFPPSRNNSHGRGYKKKILVKWEAEALQKLRAQDFIGHHGLVDVLVTFGRPDKRKRDYDNHVKPVMDLLVREGVIVDDSMDHIRIETITSSQYTGEDFRGVKVEVLDV